jgi:TonB-like protein
MYLGAAAVLAACVAGLGVARYGTAPQRSVDPQDGQVTNGAYASEYFNLSYRLPEDWVAGLEGPAPSSSGYYVLGTWITKGDFVGTILVAAQDMFFAEKPDEDVSAIAVNFRQVMSSVDGMTIDREPSEVRIGGHPGRRVDFSGVGLYRSMFATEIRCHVVTFNLTTRAPELLERLARSIDNVDEVHDKSVAAPECIKGYAVADNFIHRVEPAKVDSSAMPIPVRIVVTKDGDVRDVHVIRATAAQKRNIEEALRQWKFKPYVSQGRAVDIETGVTIRM